MTIEIQLPWARSSDKMRRRFCGFMTIANRSEIADRLVSAASPASRCIAICGIKVVGSQTTMRTLKNGLAIPANTILTLRPRGYHLYFLGTGNWPKRGEKVPVTLTFEKAGRREIMLNVEAPGPVGKEALNE
jgi:hypothetical protein